MLKNRICSCRLVRIPSSGTRLLSSSIAVRWNLPVQNDKNDNAPSPFRKVTYEPPRLPPIEKPKATIANALAAASGRSSESRRQAAKVLFGFAAVIWAAWIAKTFIVYDETDPADQLDRPALDRQQFSTFIITHREEVGRDCVMLELSPPWQKVTHLRDLHSRHKPEQDPRDPPNAGDPGIAGYWDGSRVWSVEVKQPELQIARKYTPLPMYYEVALRTVSVTAVDEKPKIENVKTSLLRMYGNQKEQDEAKIVLFVRKYDDGEVSRWLYSLPPLARVQLRGPHTELELPLSVQPRSILNLKRRYKEHKSPTTPPLRRPMLDNPSKLKPDYRPDAKDIVFYAAGTGIAPALQLLLSKNPVPGKMILHYSVRDRSDIVCPRFLYFLERTGRAEIHYHIDNEGTFLGSKDVPVPWKEGGDGWFSKSEVTWEPEKYKSAVELHDAQIAKYKGHIPSKPAFSIVCGPEGYIEYVAGKRDADSQGHVGGLLAKRGWDDSNVYKL